MDNTKLPAHVANPDPNIYLSDNYLVLDVETTTLDFGAATNPENELLLIVAGAQGKYKKSKGNELEQAEILKMVEDADFLVMQNAKFDLQWLIRCGVDPTQVVIYDTMLGKYIQEGNQPWKPKDLNSIAKHYGLKMQKDNVVNKMIKMGIDTRHIPYSWMAPYCVQDVRLTEEVFLRQREQLKDQQLLPVLYTRCLFTPVLADVEFNGMCLDPELVEKEYYRLLNRKIELDHKMDRLTGGINSSSATQVSEFLFKTLRFPPPRKNGKVIVNKKGDHPTGKEVIAALKPTTKRQKEFLALKQELGSLNAAISKNLEFFQGVCKEKEGGIFKAKFNQAVTKTQRLSSSGMPLKFELFPKQKSVQFQNMPRIYKPLFKARQEGWLIGEIDQAQLEFRVAGFLGKDEQIYHDVINEEDIHRYTASILNDIPEEEVTKEQRTDAKADTFKPAFGGEKGTEAQEKYYKAFQEKYHQLYATQTNWCMEVLANKKLTLPTGSVMYWPDTKLSKSGYNNNRHKIFNLPIQHLATAEIVPIGVTYQWHRLKAEKLNSFLVNTIHDSSIGEVHPDETEIYSELGEQSFVKDTIQYLDTVYGINFDMPLEAEVEFGHWWAVKLGDDNPLND